MKRGKQVTIYDVAVAADVSVTMVSFVLNGRDDRVSPETAGHIRAVMDKLGYRPRAHRARSKNLMRRDKGRARQVAPGQVALLIPDPDPAAAQTRAISFIAPALSRRLAEFDLDLITVSAGVDGQVPLCLAKGQVQGVILRAGQLSGTLRDALARIPCVQFYGVTSLEEGTWDDVTVDDDKMGRLAADYLVRQGCDELLVLDPDEMHPSFHLRTQAFRFGARLAGIEAQALSVVNGQSLQPAIKSRTLPRRGRLGIYLAGTNDYNTPHQVAAWLDACGLSNPDRVMLLNIAPGPWLDADCVRIAHHCAEQLYWRMQHPQAERRRVMVAPRIISGSLAAGRNAGDLPGEPGAVRWGAL